jgi:hypothetical protein
MLEKYMKGFLLSKGWKLKRFEIDRENRKIA